MALAIEKQFGIVPDLKKGSMGLFDVYADGEILYSNRKEGGRLPQNDEIIEKLRQYQEHPDRPLVRNQEIVEIPMAESGCT